MPELAIHYNLNFEDYMSAQLLHAKRGVWSRFRFFLAWWVYPAAGFCFLICAALMWGGHASIGSIVPVIVGGIVLGGWRFFVRMQYKKRYQSTRRGHGQAEMEILFRDDKFFTELPDFSKGEFSWNAVTSWRENAEVLMIYLAPALFIAIPKRAISEQQLLELRNLLDRKIATVVS